MTVENIFAEAARIGYRTIALTDHYNDDIDDAEALRRLETLRKQGKKIGEPCKVLYGMELSGYGIGKTLEAMPSEMLLITGSIPAITITLIFGSRRKKGLPAAMLGTRLRMSPHL